MDIFEMIEEAKKSEYGVIWYSEKGPIQISKEGILTPIKLRELPKYQPKRSKREDGIMYMICSSCGKYEHIDHIYRCGALNSMET